MNLINIIKNNYLKIIPILIIVLMIPIIDYSKIPKISNYFETVDLYFKNGLAYKVGTKKRYSGNYSLNKGNGEKIFRNYKNGLEHGISKAYFANGKLESSALYKNGKKIGKWKYYGIIDGKTFLKEEYLYEDNLKNGPYRKFLKSDQLLEEGSYKFGKKDGIWKTYHSNGVLKNEKEYEIGKLNGQEKIYYDDGKILNITNWNEGLALGDTTYFYPSGQIKRKFKNNRGKPIGTEKTFYENGDLASLGYWDEKNCLKEYFEYDKSGKATKETKKDNNCKIIFSKYGEKVFTGEKKTLNSEGVVVKIENYKNQKLHGTIKEFFDNKNVHKIKEFNNGIIINEKIYSYYGNLVRFNKYKNQKIFYYQEYYEDGSLEESKENIFCKPDSTYNNNAYYNQTPINFSFSSLCPNKETSGRSYSKERNDKFSLIKEFDQNGSLARERYITSKNYLFFVKNYKTKNSGSYQRFYKNTQTILEEGNFEDNYQIGTIRAWSTNGKQLLEYNCVKKGATPNIDGVYIENYRDTHNTWINVNFKDGVPDGWIVVYSQLDREELVSMYYDPNDSWEGYGSYENFQIANKIDRYVPYHFRNKSVLRYCNNLGL